MSRTTSRLESLESRVLFAGESMVSVTSHCVTEPPAGQSTVDFTVTLDQASASTIRVDYATSDSGAVAARLYKFDGGARAGQDYLPTAGRLTFAPGETSKTVSVPLLADNLTESDEAFCLNLSVFNGPADVQDGQGVATIFANSNQPAPAVSDVAVNSGQVATFAGTNGRAVRVLLKGPGAGTVTQLGGGAATLSLTGTTAESTLTVSGATSFHSVSVDGSLKGFLARQADVAGDFTVSGSVATLALHNAAGGGTLTIGDGAGAPTSLTLAHVCDYSVDAPALGTVRINRWMDTDAGRDLLSVDSIESLTVRDCFQGDVETGSIGSLVIGGAMSGSDVVVATEVDAVRVGSLLDSRIYVGVAGGVGAGLPDARNDFASGSRIGTFSIAGNAAGLFRGSTLAAANLGTLSLGTVRATNGGASFGVFTDSIGAVRGRSIETGPFAYARLSTPHIARAELDFRVVVL
jgi:hypothetical protein